MYRFEVRRAGRCDMRLPSEEGAHCKSCGDQIEEIIALAPL
jgi:rRNA maturation endonuclease Nob1